MSKRIVLSVLLVMLLIGVLGSTALAGREGLPEYSVTSFKTKR